MVRGLKFVFLVIFLGNLFIACNTQSKSSKSEPEYEIITPQEAIQEIARGINIGNTLEPPEEGGWNNGPLQKSHFEDIKKAGFASVRIPVKWGPHTADTPPFQIDPQWIGRVEQVIDWGLEEGLYLIINAHHENWLKEDFSPVNAARFDSIWSQVAERFKDKSPKLFFEILNEPIGLTTEQVDRINSQILCTIRRTNPTRIVLYSGRDYSGLQYMKEAAVPDDDYIMAYFHSYDPWKFAGEGEGTWGTDGDINSIKAMFEEAALWSSQKNIPVMINEFGAVHDCDYNSRMRHYFTYVENAVKYTIGFQVWDDGGWFGIYDRENRTWPEVKDILIYTYPDSPTDLKISVDGNPNTALLSWHNRTAETIKIIVERKTNDGEFEILTEIAKEKTKYMDNSIAGNTTYTYRIIAKNDKGTDRYSYPYKISVK